MNEFLLLKPLKDAVITAADNGVPVETISRVLMKISAEIAVVYGIEKPQWESHCEEVYAESMKNYMVEMAANKNPVQA
jgi:hypothetical protein